MSIVAFANATPDSTRAQPYLPSNFSIVASAAPAHYTGQCPVKINFHVAVTSKMSGLASLKRDAFDTNLFPNYLLEFTQPGTTTLNMTRNQSTSVSGWEMFSLIGSVKGPTSGRVLFNVVCTNPPPPAPGNPTTSFTPQPGTEPLKYPKAGTGNVAPANPVPVVPPSSSTSDVPARQQRSTQR